MAVHRFLPCGYSVLGFRGDSTTYSERISATTAGRCLSSISSVTLILTMNCPPDLALTFSILALARTRLLTFTGSENRTLSTYRN